MTKPNKANQLPRFNISASDRPLADEESDPDAANIRSRLLNAFTSTQPVTNSHDLFGRYEDLQTLIVAVSEQRAHALVYGPRGYGKTSLVRVFAEIAEDADYVVKYHSCGKVSSFSDLFSPYLDFSLPRHGPKAAWTANLPNGMEDETLAERLPTDEFTARELADVLATVEGTRLIFIVDEYDRITDLSIQREMANLIKDLSDVQARVHLVLVGVAGNVQELLGFHPSIHRSLVCIPLERLGADDATQVIEHGASECGLQFDSDVIEAIASIAYGSAYHLRLMCMEAGLAALRNGRTKVDIQAMCDGLQSALDQWCALDEVSVRIVKDIKKDSFALAAVAAIARTSLMNGDKFTVSEAAPLLLSLLDAEKTRQLSLRLGRYCKELAAKDGLLVAERRNRAPTTYSFKNHLAAPFLLMACYLEMAEQTQAANGLAECRGQ